MGWEKLEDALEALETEREYDGYFCSVKDAVTIAVLGSLCGLKSVLKIHHWAMTEHITEFLEKDFGIRHVPCYWWLLQLMSMVTPESLNLCMRNWVQSLIPGLVEQVEQEEACQNKKKKALTIAVDGKEIRSTKKMSKYESPIHIVSAQVGELGLTLAQETVAGKSNEIPAVQKLIKTLEISGCIVVADALNCQIDTAQAVLDAKADYLLSAKDNQQTLKDDIEEYVRDEKLRAKMDTAETRERGHGRKETRTAFVTDDVSWQPGGRKWPGLKCIGALHTQFETKGGKSDEWHYYISSRNLTAQELLHHARAEWSVESMHWLLDVHYDEDRCRVQCKTLQQNLNMLHKFALNIVRLNKRETSSKESLSGIMFRCLMNPYDLLRVLGKN